MSNRMMSATMELAPDDAVLSEKIRFRAILDAIYGSEDTKAEARRYLEENGMELPAGDPLISKSRAAGLAVTLSRW